MRRRLETAPANALPPEGPPIGGLEPASVQCPRCGGRGTIPFLGVLKRLCGRCQGTGTV